MAGSTVADKVFEVVRTGDLEALQWLTAANRRLLNARSGRWPGLSPLALALISGQGEVAGYLIEHGASTTRGASHHATLLHIAASSNLAGAAELLIRRGSSVNARNVEKETPLHHAARAGAVQAGTVLVEYGADVDALDCGGISARYSWLPMAATESS